MKLNPFLMAADGAAACDFYARAFGAEQLSLERHADGRFLHAELRIGETRVMIGEHANLDTRDPNLLPRASVWMETPDCDAVFARAVAAGARVIYPPTEQPYGCRDSGVEDPFGIVWWIGTERQVR